MKLSICNILLASAIVAISTVDAKGGLRNLEKDVRFSCIYRIIADLQIADYAMIHALALFYYL